MAVSGRVRLLIEIAVFGLGAYGWFVTGPMWLAWANVSGLVAHYALSYDRVAWLLKTGPESGPVSEIDQRPPLADDR